MRLPLLNVIIPLLREISNVWSRSTTVMSWIEPANRVFRVAEPLWSESVSCVRRASTTFTRASNSRTKMGLVR